MVGVPPTRENADTSWVDVGVEVVALIQFTPLKVAALAVFFMSCWIWVISDWILLRSMPAVLASTSSAWSLVRPELPSLPITAVSAVYSVSTVAADRPSESETAESAALSARIEVAIDQYAALSEAVATRMPVEIRFCVTERLLLTDRR